MKLCGFSLFEGGENQPLRVAQSVRKGNGSNASRYFDTVVLMGKIRRLVDEAVRTEYGAHVHGSDVSF